MNKKVYVDLSQQDVQDIINAYEKDIEKFNKQKEVLNKLKVVYTSMQFSAPENMYIFIEQMGDLLEEIE